MGASLVFSKTEFLNLRAEDYIVHHTNPFILHDSFMYVQFVVNKCDAILPLILPCIMSLFTPQYRQQLTYWGYSY